MSSEGSEAPDHDCPTPATVPRAHYERTRSGCAQIVATGDALTRRRARYRVDRRLPGRIQGHDAGDPDGLPPAATLLADHERRPPLRGWRIGPACGAVACRSARDRVHEHERLELGQLRQARDHDCPAPAAAALADHEGRPASCGGAVTRRRTRQRVDLREHEGACTPDLESPSPASVSLVYEERMLPERGVLVVPAGDAVARRAARYRVDVRVVRAERGDPGNRDGVTPAAGPLSDYEGVFGLRAVRVEPAGGAVAGRWARNRCDGRGTCGSASPRGG